MGENRISAAAALECEWLNWQEDKDGYLSRVCLGDSLFKSLLSCVNRAPEDHVAEGKLGSVGRSGSNGSDTTIQLGTFAHLTRFEKTVMMLAAHQSDATAHEEARAQFMAMDTDQI